MAQLFCTFLLCLLFLLEMNYLGDGIAWRAYCVRFHGISFDYFSRFCELHMGIFSGLRWYAGLLDHLLLF